MLKDSFKLLAALCSILVSVSNAFGTPGLLGLRTLPESPKPSAFPRGIKLTTRPPIDLRMSSEEESSASEGSDEPIDTSASSGGNTQTVQKKSVSAVKSLFQRIDDGGQKLKPMALTAKEKAKTLESGNKSVLYTIKSCVLFSLFIIYRAYRGFFVILPAVFREVYSKLETAVESPFEDTSTDPQTQDVNPSTGKLRARTTITVSVLASVVTASYVAGGAFRVLKKFLKTVFSTNKVATSFEAAADEIVVNEDKILRMTKHDNGINSMDVNGGGLEDVAP